MNGFLILSVIAIYFFSLLLISWFTGCKNTDNDGFFLAHRRSPWIIVAIGMVGTSISGVSFVSVPGWVRTTDMTYMQMVLGFILGYAIIAKVLLPLYYRLQLTSIYEYLKSRMGHYSYKTGASFFLLSKTLGAAARLYLVVVILQTYVFDQWKIPFLVTTALSVLLIWLYTFRSGIRTIVWTDTLQTFCFIGMLVIIIWQVKKYMNLDFSALVKTVTDSQHFYIFEFENWSSKQHFVKQFFSGVFTSIVMTGLDQDMMQKNLTCRNLKEAQKNMYFYSIAFTPINLLFLCLGVLLVTLAAQINMTLPVSGDDILPVFCTSGMMGIPILVFFTIGIIAAAFSSADSALASLTTSFCVDILDIKKETVEKAKKIRLKVHMLISIVFILIILLFRSVNNRSIIDAIYTIASYTYGPLLGLFVFGLFTKYKVRDKFVPYVCLTSPILCLTFDWLISYFTTYRFGYEILMLNGFLTFIGLLLCREKNEELFSFQKRT